jgi:hypothetical protein
MMKSPHEAAGSAAMRRFIDLRIFCFTIAVASLIAFGLHRWVGLNFWACLGIVLVGIFVNGIVATIEDELPEGFNNPTPARRSGDQRLR